MKIGITPINSARYIEDQVALVDFVQMVEELGYESVWTFEHVIVPNNYESVYPYNPSGKLGLKGAHSFVDPLFGLTFIAGATKKLRLGTGVNILPQVNPLYTAKFASSLDHLSNGRFMFGVGVGWLEEEFNAIGVPFENRGKRTDEYIDAMRAAWRGEMVEYRGEFVDWHDFQMLPTPVQAPRGVPGVPLIIGGTSPVAIRRLVARGDGWYVIHKDLEEFKTHMDSFRAECDRQGRDPSELEITAYWNHSREGTESVEEYRREGVSRLLVNADALRMGDKPADALERFAAEVLTAL